MDMIDIDKLCSSRLAAMEQLLQRVERRPDDFQFYIKHVILYDGYRIGCTQYPMTWKKEPWSGCWVRYA